MFKKLSAFGPKILNVRFFVLILVIAQCVAYGQPKQNEIADRKSFLTRSLSLEAVYGQQNYQVFGSGFTADMTGANVNGYSFDWIDQVDQQFFQLEYQTSTINSKVPSGLTPAEVKQKLEKISLQFFVPKEAEDKIYFSYGLFYQSRAVQEDTRPNAILLSSRRFGPEFSVMWADNYSQTFSYLIDVGLGVPLWFEELDKSSGSLQYSATARAKYMFVYHLNEIFDAGIGLKIQLEDTKFKHTGTRGTVDAEERFLNFEIPLQLRARF